MRRRLTVAIGRSLRLRVALRTAVLAEGHFTGRRSNRAYTTRGSLRGGDSATLLLHYRTRNVLVDLASVKIDVSNDTAREDRLDRPRRRLDGRIFSFDLFEKKGAFDPPHCCV